MATKAEFDAKFDEADVKLDAIIADIQALKDQLATGGLTPAEEEAVKARLDALVAKAGSIDDATP